MKIYFMKQESLELLKSNLESVFMKYFTESNNEWIYDVCGENPFVEFKDIRDFELQSLDKEKTKGEIEFNNCKIMYSNLNFLNDSQASDERLWAGLCHSTFYDYMRRKWEYDVKDPHTIKEAISNIKSRFFFSGGTRAGIYRNTLSKCWWVGKGTYDDSKQNKFEKLDILGHNDISSKISDIFYSNTFSSNPRILQGILEGLNHFQHNENNINVKDHIRPSLQLLNAIGGFLILDCLNSKEIANIVIDNIERILNGNLKGIELSNIEDEEEFEKEVHENIEEDKRVILGSKVIVRNILSNKEKTIKVDYLKDIGDIPIFAKTLLQKKIGERSFYNDEEYEIIKII